MSLIGLYQDQLYGVVQGLDRIRFRGTERMLSNVAGFAKVLSKLGVLLKDFGAWAERRTTQLRAECAQQASALGIPVEYLERANQDKEALARRMAEAHGLARE